MERVVDITGLFATAILFGSMALLSAVTAPLVFAKLLADVAADFVRAVCSCYSW
jgi:putative flippase GtrA